MEVIKDPEGNETAQLLALQELSGARVLEIGCGDGRMTWRYAALPRAIMAFDSDADKLAIAEAQPAEPSAQVCDFSSGLSGGNPICQRAL